jgi:hypothetical protein
VSLRARATCLVPLLIVNACSGARAPAPGPPFVGHEAPLGGNGGLDADGVQMLFAAAPGSSFDLDGLDPNDGAGGRFEIERETRASPASGGALRSWNVVAHAINYASGGAGQTIRLHIRPGGGRQRLTWQTQQGYLSAPTDVRNQEFTAYVRAHGIFDVRRAAITLKIRGGEHTERDGDRASCIMMTLAPREAGAVTRFGKELTHPIYDYVTLAPHFDAALVAEQWFGLKLVSYAAGDAPARVVNELYLDTEPFDASGRPQNHWRLFSQYVDVEGVSTGHYDKLVDWGGWHTTLRVDGIHDIDFALLSVREIAPPSPVSENGSSVTSHP